MIIIFLIFLLKWTEAIPPIDCELVFKWIYPDLSFLHVEILNLTENKIIEIGIVVNEEFYPFFYDFVSNTSSFNYYQVYFNSFSNNVLTMINIDHELIGKRVYALISKSNEQLRVTSDEIYLDDDHLHRVEFDPEINKNHFCSIDTRYNFKDEFMFSLKRQQPFSSSASYSHLRFFVCLKNHSCVAFDFNQDGGAYTVFGLSFFLTRKRVLMYKTTNVISDFAFLLDSMQDGKRVLTSCPKHFPRAPFIIKNILKDGVYWSVISKKLTDLTISIYDFEMRKVMAFGNCNYTNKALCKLNEDYSYGKELGFNHLTFKNYTSKNCYLILNYHTQNLQNGGLSVVILKLGGKVFEDIDYKKLVDEIENFDIVYHHEDLRNNGMVNVSFAPENFEIPHYVDIEHRINTPHSFPQIVCIYRGMSDHERGPYMDEKGSFLSTFLLECSLSHMALYNFHHEILDEFELLYLFWVVKNPYYQPDRHVINKITKRFHIRRERAPSLPKELRLRLGRFFLDPVVLDIAEAPIRFSLPFANLNYSYDLLIWTRDYRPEPRTFATFRGLSTEVKTKDVVIRANLPNFEIYGNLNHVKHSVISITYLIEGKFYKCAASQPIYIKDKPYFNVTECNLLELRWDLKFNEFSLELYLNENEEQLLIGSCNITSSICIVYTNSRVKTLKKRELQFSSLAEDLFSRLTFKFSLVLYGDTVYDWTITRDIDRNKPPCNSLPPHYTTTNLPSFSRIKTSSSRSSASNETPAKLVALSHYRESQKNSNVIIICAVLIPMILIVVILLSWYVSHRKMKKVLKLANLAFALSNIEN